MSKTEEKVYLLGINGLRTIAALSVLVCHIFYTNIGAKYVINWPIAHYGVTLFFVISGFLITYLLLKERENTNNISVSSFYIRRILRIWPIYYLYITISIVVYFFAGKQEQVIMPQMLFYLLLIGNFIKISSIISIVPFGHLWSISVEEQFYLFWPWLIKKIKKIKNIIIVAVVIFLVLFILKTTVWYLEQKSGLYALLKETRFQCMMIGCLGAILYHLKNQLFINIFTNKWLQLASWLMYFLVGFNVIYIPVVVAHEVLSVFCLSMLVGQLFPEKRLFSLEKKFFEFIGKISYGIYVIHPLLLIILSHFFRKIEINFAIKWFLFFAISFSLTILLSWLSYNYFEKYFLKLKSRFAIIKSSNISNSKN